MKGFIEITPRWYSPDFLDMEGEWTIKHLEYSIYSEIELLNTLK